jgi:hypothetical protein
MAQNKDNQGKNVEIHRVVISNKDICYLNGGIKMNEIQMHNRKW